MDQRVQSLKFFDDENHEGLPEQSSLEALTGGPYLPSLTTATCCSAWDNLKMSNHCLQQYRSVYPPTPPNNMTDDTDRNLNL